MTDDIVTRLANLADSYKRGKMEMLYADYETICDAWREVEHLRKDVTELLQIAKLFADEGSCWRASFDGDCGCDDCKWHGAEHMWESFCMRRGI